MIFHCRGVAAAVANAIYNATGVRVRDYPVDIQQDDTFFLCNTGRFKLRTFAAGNGELIYYRRATTDPCPFRAEPSRYMA
ncbi:hypothetical protein [Variovorax sp. DT-64]|uniref:hypothetical protein n=1 Tax=Variovorax sp. DT-64 TaxID=3396160 RepID=UPI003F19F658